MRQLSPFRIRIDLGRMCNKWSTLLTPEFQNWNLTTRCNLQKMSEQLRISGFIRNLRFTWEKKWKFINKKILTKIYHQAILKSCILLRTSNLIFTDRPLFINEYTCNNFYIFIFSEHFKYISWNLNIMSGFYWVVLTYKQT